MAENPAQTCLFLGGTADGKHLEVDATLPEHRIPSFSHSPTLHDETPEEALEDGNPVPDAVPVREIYRRFEIDYGGKKVIGYAIASMGEAAIRRRLIPYFGEE